METFKQQLEKLKAIERSGYIGRWNKLQGTWIKGAKKKSVSSYSGVFGPMPKFRI